MVTKCSQERTVEDEGVKVIENKPIEDGSGQYTLKHIFVGKSLPGYLTSIVPGLKELTLVEESWNRYPHCLTKYSCDAFGDRFDISVESMHVDNDRGEQENACNLDEKKLKLREVFHLDLTDVDEKHKDYNPERDLRTFKSDKTGRGELQDGWKKDAEPVMCCYKVSYVKLSGWWIPGFVETMIQDNSRDIMLKAQQDVFCLIDEWFGLSLEDIRDMEKKSNDELAKKLADKEDGDSDNSKADGEKPKE
eukprot:1010490_1